MQSKSVLQMLRPTLRVRPIIGERAEILWNIQNVRLLSQEWCTGRLKVSFLLVCAPSSVFFTHYRGGSKILPALQLVALGQK